MARSSSVNFESVEQICFQLLSQGENPSFNLVYAELGNKGSSEIVQRYMDQWRRETGAAFFRQRSIPGMPDELVPSVDAFMARIWSLALQSADLVFATQREKLEKEQESVRARLQAADERILQMEAEAAQATAHIGALNQGVQACESTISELRSQALELHRQREALEIRIKQLEEAVDVRDQKFVTESERLTRLLQNDRDRYAASLKEEQDRSAVDRELLMRQIDQARQEKLAEITSMRQQIANREERETKQREQTEEAKAALREAVSRTRQSETSLAAAEGRIERLQAQLKVASEAAHGKESAVAAAEARARAVEDVRLAETARAHRAEAALAEALVELGILKKQGA
ncbi:MAG: DNA-binding protein [Zoogloea oleivorans]|jgi:chromosome segregation ATPase|uniref:DNA-binding protein n=1 Tax=Zoogloea oleivorans TaxID=1552750 RepID=UPI002A36F61F|nr:DNA-binding protein [Zoogloea oleivorans]MDY0037924.1 DNA-binding protein [Zoogloea oleivorans]